MKKTIIFFTTLILLFSVFFVSAEFVSDDLNKESEAKKIVLNEILTEKTSFNFFELPARPILFPEIPSIPKKIILNQAKPIRQNIIGLKNMEKEKNTGTGCVDSDGGINAYIPGTMTIIYGNDEVGNPATSVIREETCNYNDYLNPNTHVNELYCGLEPYYNNNNWVPCPLGCYKGACIHGEISIATMKDIYRPGEKILLTDPPEAGKLIVKNKNGINNNVIISGKEKLNEFDGYIVEFEGNPTLVERYELEKVSLERGKEIDLNKKIKEYSKEVSEENEKIKKIIEKELGKKIKFENDFTTALNGVHIKGITKEEADKIEKIKGVKRVTENNFVQATLMNSTVLINADDVWDMYNPNNLNENLTGKGVTIGIIDTGIDWTHFDLGGCLGVGCKVVDGYNFLENNSNFDDDHGHGTHVASTAAGNGVLKGVAPDANLYSFKVLNNMGWGTWAAVISAIERSSDLDDDGIPMENEDDYLDVISMSLGGFGNPDDPASTAVDNVVNAGVVAVIAAGNSGPGSGTIMSPGNSRKAITVGATDKWDQLASFSSRGPVIWNNEVIMKPDLVAPGVDICAAQWNNAWQQYECLDTEHTSISGTSMATPHVAGAAAILLQKDPELTPDEVKSILKESSASLPYTETEIGKGRLDVFSAVTTSDRPQSKIVNYGDVDITAVLLMKVQRKGLPQGEIGIPTPLNENWQDEIIVTNQQITVPAKSTIKLDVGGNYGWNLKNVKVNKEGDYRAYASFGTNQGKIEAVWEFRVSKNVPNGPFYD